MTSNRSYLIRAINEWIADNGLTPYLLVDASFPGVQVPAQAIKDGRVVLNIALRAVAHLDLGRDWVRFSARFSGSSFNVDVPVGAVLAVYAQENGQGMMFSADGVPQSPPPPPATPDADGSSRKGSHLRVVK
ncbi:MAG: ClpXP protease specificity-enhancing factor [Tahibacter sp.]